MVCVVVSVISLLFVRFKLRLCVFVWLIDWLVRSLFCFFSFFFLFFFFFFFGGDGWGRLVSVVGFVSLF